VRRVSITAPTSPKGLANKTAALFTAHLADRWGPLRLPPDVSGGPIDLTETAVTLLIIIIILILLFGGGGYYGYRGGYYGGGGISIVGILLIFIVIWLLFGSGLHY
jgi:hypothetical protein